MKYPNGQMVKLGDKVKLWDGNEGTVVYSIDTSEYSIEYPEMEWSFLKKGILVHSRQGLIHYVEPEMEMALVKRG
jgi:hypothetical protein